MAVSCEWTVAGKWTVPGQVCGWGGGESVEMFRAQLFASHRRRGRRRKGAVDFDFEAVFRQEWALDFKIERGLRRESALDFKIERGFPAAGVVGGDCERGVPAAGVLEIKVERGFARKRASGVAARHGLRREEGEGCLKVRGAVCRKGVGQRGGGQQAAVDVAGQVEPALAPVGREVVGVGGRRSPLGLSRRGAFSWSRSGRAMAAVGFSPRFRSSPSPRAFCFSGRKPHVPKAGAEVRRLRSLWHVGVGTLQSQGFLTSAPAWGESCSVRNAPYGEEASAPDAAH